MKTYFQSLKILSEEELEQLEGLSTQRIIAKNEYLIRQGQICREVAYIESGILRSFCYSFEGKEETNCLSFDGEVMTAYRSALTQHPSEENIQALVDTSVTVIQWKDLFRLYDSSGNWEKAGRMVAEQNYIKLEKRICSLQKKSAKERYENLLHELPHYIQQVPLQYLASYLGMTQRHLSRIRSEI